MWFSGASTGQKEEIIHRKLEIQIWIQCWRYGSTQHQISLIIHHERRHVRYVTIIRQSISTLNSKLCSLICKVTFHSFWYIFSLINESFHKIPGSIKSSVFIRLSVSETQQISSLIALCQQINLRPADINLILEYLLQAKRRRTLRSEQKCRLTVAQPRSLGFCPRNQWWSV